MCSSVILLGKVNGVVVYSVDTALELVVCTQGLEGFNRRFIVVTYLVAHPVKVDVVREVNPPVG